MGKREPAFGSKYENGKLIERKLLWKINLGDDCSISTPTFKRLRKKVYEQFSDDVTYSTTFEIELPSGLHLPLDTPIVGDKMTFTPMKSPFIYYRLDVVKLKMEVDERLYIAEELNSSDAIARFMQGHLKNLDREAICVLSLDTHLRVTNINVVSIGTVNQSIAHPREIFKTAILSNASCVIMIHNHPAGSLDPSKEDLQTTEHMAMCGKILGIPLVDHIIVSRKGNLSLRSEYPELIFPYIPSEMNTFNEGVYKKLDHSKSKPFDIEID